MDLGVGLDGSGRVNEQRSGQAGGPGSKSADWFKMNNRGLSFSVEFSFVHILLRSLSYRRRTRSHVLRRAVSRSAAGRGGCEISVRNGERPKTL